MVDLSIVMLVYQRVPNIKKRVPCHFAQATRRQAVRPGRPEDLRTQKALAGLDPSGEMATGTVGKMVGKLVKNPVKNDEKLGKHDMVKHMENAVTNGKGW